MEMSKNQKIIAVVVIALLLGGIYYKMKNKDVTEIPKVTESLSTATSTDKNVVLDNNGQASYTVEKVPITPTAKNIPVPDLNRPVTFASSLVFTDEVKAMVTQKILGLQAEIKKDPSKLLYWIDLGTYQKMTGDYEGAKISWKYVSEKAPTDFISRGNLGNLYGYYIKDVAMSEMYYRDAISKDPKQVYLYIQLAEVYKDVSKDLDKSRAIIDEGLKKMPGNEALISFRDTIK